MAIPHGPNKESAVHIEHFIKGLVTNRAAISVPFRFTAMGDSIKYVDALIDGLNVELSPKNTLVRRPGWSKFSTTQLAVSEAVNGFAGVTLSSTPYTLASTNQNVYSVGGSSLTSIFTKNSSLQSFFQQVGNLLFISDGTDNKKWDGTTLTGAGLTAPTAAPTIPNLNLYDSGGGTQTLHAWVPGATYTNSSGSAVNYYLEAPTGEIYWSVVPAGTTLKSQTSAPNWSSQFGVFGGVVKDGTMTWTNCGTILTWAANTAFKNSTYVTVSQFNASATPGTKTDVAGGNFAWTIGSASAGFQHGGVSDVSDALKVSNFGFAVPAGATIKGVQVIVFRATNRTNAIADADVRLTKAGTAGGTNKSTAGFWPQTAFNVNTIPVSGGVKQIYGSNTDLWGNTLTPSDVNNSGFGVQFKASLGTSNTTAAALVYPITVVVYYTVATSDITGTTYGQIIQDSNGNLQRCKVAGTSGGSQPTWSTTIGGTTTDNTITWDCLGTANQLPCLFSRTYAYGFHSGGASPHVSTMSPTLVVQAPIIGLNVNVQANGSDDTQVDRNDLYRTADGGSLLLYDTSSPNVNSSTSWTVNDTALDTDLNALLVGPVAHANDPPPSGATILAYHMGRMWAAVNNFLYFSAGPDCINGDGNQAWPPANVFTFSSNITGLAATSQGLIVFTANDMSIVLGGPQTLTFWVQPLQRNFGILTPNCLVQDGDTVYLYSSQQQLWSISAAAGKDEIGWDVAPTLAATFPAATSSIALHRSGQDQGLFISDGSANVMRYNLNARSWDAVAQPANGIGLIASVPTAIGTQTLLSANATHGFVVKRDTTTFSDAGTAYSAYATIGSLPLSQGGAETERITSIILQSAAVGTALAVGVLVNEISGSFTNIPLNSNDPPTLVASSTINMKGYDWLGVQTQLPNAIRHMQLKITLPATDTVQNEIYGVHIV